MFREELEKCGSCLMEYKTVLRLWEKVSVNVKMYEWGQVFWERHLSFSMVSTFHPGLSQWKLTK